MRVTVAVHESLSAFLLLTRSSVWHAAQAVFTRVATAASGPATAAAPPPPPAAAPPLPPRPPPAPGAAGTGNAENRTKGLRTSAYKSARVALPGPCSGR